MTKTDVAQQLKDVVAFSYSLNAAFNEGIIHRNMVPSDVPENGGEGYLGDRVIAFVHYVIFKTNVEGDREMRLTEKVSWFNDGSGISFYTDEGRVTFPVPVRFQNYFKTGE